MRNHYTVTYSSMALEDLREIYEYVRYTLIAPIAAEHQILRIRKMIASLDMFPMRRLLIRSIGNQKGCIRFLLISI